MNVFHVESLTKHISQKMCYWNHVMFKR